MSAGSVQATAVIVVAVVSIFVPVHVLMRIKWLIGVVGVAYPSRYRTRCDEHLGGGLVGVTLRVIVVEQVTGSVDHAE